LQLHVILNWRKTRERIIISWSREGAEEKGANVHIHTVRNHLAFINIEVAEGNLLFRERREKTN
jgi:hypothetical protein